MEQTSLAIQEQGAQNAIAVADAFVRKEYLSQLQEAEIAPLPAHLRRMEIGSNLRLMHLPSMAYGTTDQLEQKLTTLFEMIAEYQVHFVLILDSNQGKNDLYLGIASNEIQRLSGAFQTFKNSFTGAFPGASIKMLKTTQSKELLTSIFEEPRINLSAVSLGNVSTVGQGNPFGLEQLADGMQGKPFTLCILAQAISPAQATTMRKSYEAMYTELSPFRKQDYSISTNTGENYTQSFNVGINKSSSHSQGITESTSFTEGSSESINDLGNQEEQQKKQAKNQLAGTAISLAAILTGLGGATAGLQSANLLQGLFFGSSISNVLGSAQTLLGNAPQPEAKRTTGSNKSHSVSFGKTNTGTVQEGLNLTKGIADSSSQGTGQSVQISYENKSITTLLETVDKQIQRLQQVEHQGGFDCAAYLVAGDEATASAAANLYRSSVHGDDSSGQISALNTWSAPNQVQQLCGYLTRCNHPRFMLSHIQDYPRVSAASMVSAKEMSYYGAIPKTSIPGFELTSHAQFSRCHVGQWAGDHGVEIGNIYHMNKTTEATVALSQQDLCGHMLVAGTTGTGKSNFCYGLLNMLQKRGIKFMVIEPAKGEYSKVFGGHDQVHCFGTNPNVQPLLKINPFAFPKGIHVNEHIDNLLEIFSSCWPMYAAMPAVLKEGLEKVYERCGYNLLTGYSPRRGHFPTFADLLEILPQIIQQSDYSQEVKSNYIGSLVTRIKSVATGLYGAIFAKDELAESLIFGENVLIDLSRVGSGETKALIMGILVMRLQEYRVCTSQMNQSLQHITILEEAHHLLRKASGSSAEGVSIKEMSVERLTNAIAEMRTYGEGFVIADQSPALLDASVIRNTNTKVIFKLPEYTDRSVVAESMMLHPDQSGELAKLKCGVAVVYQSGWNEAVLSKIHHFPETNFRPYVHDLVMDDDYYRAMYTQSVAVLLEGRVPWTTCNQAICKTMARHTVCAIPEQTVLQAYVEKGARPWQFKEICGHLERLINLNQLFAACDATQSPAAWTLAGIAYLAEIYDLHQVEYLELLSLCFYLYASHHREWKCAYTAFVSYKNAGLKAKTEEMLSSAGAI